jgi:hypothetical protein
MGMEQKRELKQENTASKTLSVGDQIPYNNTEYKVLEKKGKTFTIEDQTTMEKIKVQPTYGLFKKLVEAKNNPAAQELVAAGMEEQVENSHKIRR